MDQALRFQGFDWDQGNLIKNLKKHGIDQDEIEAMFDRPIVYRESGKLGQAGEKRFIAVGTFEDGWPMMVVFTFREREGKLLLRPISARPMHAGEAKNMKTNKKKIEVEDDPLAGDMSAFLAKGGFKPLIYEKEPKDTTVTLRVPKSLITRAKFVAKKKHMKYQRMMRQAIVEYVAQAF